MNIPTCPERPYLVAIALTSLLGVSLVGCNSNSGGGAKGGSGGASGQGTGGKVTSGGTTSTSSASSSGGTTGQGGTSASGGSTNTGGAPSSGGKTASSSSTGTGGATGNGGTAAAGTAGGGSTANVDAPVSDQYVVALVQSTKAQASDLTTSDVADMVSSAVSQAGGFDFIKDGQTVILKPNLVTAYTDGFMTKADMTVNGIATDWRVVKAVADLVRAKNPKGKILVMEGSTLPAATAFSILGYTSANFGSSVDEFVAIEGASCTDTSTGALEQQTSRNGKQYWVNSRYFHADVIISMPTMKTHLVAGISGSVKNLGIGTTPVGQFSSGTNTPTDCTRGQTPTAIDHTSPETLGQFIRDYYSIRPADFAVMDGLQGLEHGPLPAWDRPPDGGMPYDYASSKKNMRLILAGRNAVAVDTIEALVMKCDPKQVPHLTKLEADNLGTTDVSKITVVGNKQVSDVATPFAGAQTSICPGI